MCEKHATQDFVHLHCHSDFSIQDALPKPKGLAKKAREMGFKAVAITDHGRMGGVVEFVDGCRAPMDDLPPIKPIIGCEVYTYRDRFEKCSVERADGTKGRPKHNHLTLLARNQTGYRNLLNLCSIGAEEGFYYDPVVDEPAIEPRADGLIAASGCLAGEVCQAILKGDEEKAEKIIRRHKEIFGEDNYYVELQYHGIAEQKACLPVLARLADKTNTKMIATNDVHYLEQQDWSVHRVNVLARDATGGTIKEDGGKWRGYGTKQFWLKNTEEMQTVFGQLHPSVLTNTIELADRVEDYMKLDVPHLLPHVAIPTDNPKFNAFWKKHLPYHAANEAYLAYLGMEGLTKLGLNTSPEYTNRLKHELQIIWNMGVVDYFLIQYEMVDFMRSQDILYGIRGSGVGSLVLFAIGVNTIADPLRWNLMFERFLNPGRGEQYKFSLSCLPFKQWLDEFGKVDQSAATAQIKRTIKEKSCDKEFEPYAPAIAKELWVLENQGYAAYLLDVAQRGMTTKTNECNSWATYFLGITNQRPDGSLIVSKVATLPDVDTDIMAQARPSVIEWARGRFGKDHVSMIATYGTYQAKAAVKVALKTSERFIKEHGNQTHIKAEEITKFIPMRQQPSMTIEDAVTLSPEFAHYAKKYLPEISIARKLIGVNSHVGVHPGGVIIGAEPIHDHSPIENSKGVLASAYDMGSVERVGLVKYDYLGLSTYDLIYLTLNLIKTRHGETVNLTKIDFDDPKVLELYARGKTASLFQFASGGMQKSLKEVRVDSVEDLIAVNALFRPGPMEYIPDYGAGKRNPEDVKYSHPLIKKYLQNTYGIIVYQEQAMLLCKEMGDLDWDEVDKIRKAVSKKDDVLFGKITKVFHDKAIKKGVPESVVNEVLQLMSKFQGYAFNRSHACIYSLLSYYTAYLRTYYKEEFMAACMHVDRDDEDKIAVYRRECRELNITVEPPNVNESTFQTTVSKDGRVLLPLDSIKGVGTLAQCIVDNQPFESLKDFCYRARPNLGMVKALAENQALKCFSDTRLLDAESIVEQYTEFVNQRTREEKQAAAAAKAKYRSLSPMMGEEAVEIGEGRFKPARSSRPTRKPLSRVRLGDIIDTSNPFDKGMLG